LVGLAANLLAAICLYGSDIEGALVTFSVFEFGVLAVIYGLIFFYRSKPEIIDAAVGGCTSLTSRCGVHQPQSEYESPIEHNTEFHPIINNPDNTNLYDTVNESSRSEVIIAQSSENEQEQQEKNFEKEENDAKESVKGTPFDSEAAVEEGEAEVKDQNNNSDVEDKQVKNSVKEEKKSENNNEEIDETMQNSSSFAEITPDSEFNEKSSKTESPAATNDN